MLLVGRRTPSGTTPIGISIRDTNLPGTEPILPGIVNVHAVRRNSMDEDKDQGKVALSKCNQWGKAWMARSHRHHYLLHKFHGHHSWLPIMRCRWWHRCSTWRLLCQQLQHCRPLWLLCSRCRSNQIQWQHRTRPISYIFLCGVHLSYQHQIPSCWSLSNREGRPCRQMCNKRSPSTKVPEQLRIFSQLQSKWLVPKKITSMPSLEDLSTCMHGKDSLPRQLPIGKNLPNSSCSTKTISRNASLWPRSSFWRPKWISIKPGKMQAK